MHYQIAETPEMTGPQFQAKAAQVKKLIAQRKTHQAADFKAQAAKPGSQRASSAELDRLRGENATLRAKLATGKPAAPTAVPCLSPRDQRRAAAKGTIADQPDGQLVFVAGHRSATDADRSAARAELESRGWQIHANGAFSLSTTKKPRR